MAEPITLVLTEELKKRYQELPAPIQKKFQKQLRFLQNNPKHPSLRIHRLNDEWEFYTANGLKLDFFTASKIIVLAC